MPGCSTARHPSGVEITFTEDDHRYVSTINGCEYQYVSGTGFLSKYFPKFDPTGEITARCARREGLTVEALKAKWAAKGANSCRIGTRTHETIEDGLLNRPYRNIAEDSIEEKRFDYAKRLASKLKSSIDILGVEKIVFSPELLVAGTIDLFAKSRKTGCYVIIDHKTNEKIETENTYNKFCLGPIAHLPDTNFYHYALQLNLYQYLLMRGKYVPQDAKFGLLLNHITHEGQKWYPLPDLQSEIKDLMIDYLLDKNEQLNSSLRLF